MDKYRYNLSDELLTYIKINFINQFDHEKFDKCWKNWITMERVKILFKMEENRLINEGWSGNINEKIKTSIKYYYLNKDENEKSTKKKRRKYIHINDKLSGSMNDFINKTKIKKPAAAYEKFIKDNKPHYKTECLRLKEYIQNNDISFKIKKTFKNKFYLKNKT